MFRRFPLVLVFLFSLLSGCVTGSVGTKPAVRDRVFNAAIDGTPQMVVLKFPAGYERGAARDILIALHGHGADRWQFLEDKRDECRAVRDFAEAHGMILVSPDYRAATSWMGPKAEADVVQIIADLKREYKVSRVFVCGASMGGTASLTFAVIHPELVDGVASMNGHANFIEFTHFPEAIQESFGGTKGEFPVEYQKRSAEFHPEKLTMPVGLTVSGQDFIVPPGSILRLAEALKARGARVLLLHRENRGHSTSYADAREVLEFMLSSADVKNAAAAK